MKYLAIFVAVLLGIIVPILMFSRIPKQPQPVSEIIETTSPTTVTVGEPHHITLLQPDGSCIVLPLEEYIVRVVLREMPAEFEYEALKAQAVVARTYTLRKTNNAPKHGMAAVCTEAACCQGYRMQEEYLSSGGTQQLLEKVTNAVHDTAGIVLAYNGELIEATYFSCSGGKTEDALAVWGNDIPYLRSTASPGEEKATHFTDTVSFSKQEFASLLKLDKSIPSYKWVEEITYTNGGGVARIRLCGRDYSGTEIRHILGIRSTAFTMTVIGDQVIITTRGYGHRVGMSQYGADAMAVDGKDYAQILAHYYQDTKLVSYETLD